MARCEIKLPDDFLQKVSHLGDKTDEIIAKSIEAGGEVVLAKAKGNLRAVVGKGTKYKSRSIGELAGALGLSPVKVNRQGIHNAKVGFSEPRRKQYAAKGKRSYSAITNAMLATVLEYGKHGQPAKPFLKPAKSSSRKSCQEEMQRVLEEEIDKL